jgi:hypothetical protein
MAVPHKYELIVYWNAKDAAFVVDVPELPGCMAHGAGALPVGLSQRFAGEVDGDALDISARAGPFAEVHAR